MEKQLLESQWPARRPINLSESELLIAHGIWQVREFLRLASTQGQTVASRLKMEPQHAHELIHPWRSEMLRSKVRHVGLTQHLFQYYRLVRHMLL